MPTAAEQAKAYTEFIESLGPEKLRQIAEKALADATEEYREFRSAFAVGMCYLCGKALATFSAEKPCLHWLLKPKGFEKHFPMIATSIGYFQTQSYLRWIANADALGKNINDLPDEGTGKVLECTIRFRHLEWSFSCAEGDLRGHDGSTVASEPHYHFQMRIDQKPFINFNDFHIPLAPPDALQIEGMLLRPDLIRTTFPFGEGVREVLESTEAIEFILNSPSTASGGEEGPIHFQSFIQADEGSTIRGDDLYALIHEAKTKGVTVASLLHKLPNTTSQVLVGPSPSVVEQAPRSGGRK